MSEIKSDLTLKNIVIILFILVVAFWLSYTGATGEIETALETKMKGFTFIL